MSASKFSHEWWGLHDKEGVEEVAGDMTSRLKTLFSDACDRMKRSYAYTNEDAKSYVEQQMEEIFTEYSDYGANSEKTGRVFLNELIFKFGVPF